MIDFTRLSRLDRVRLENALDAGDLHTLSLAVECVLGSDSIGRITHPHSDPSPLPCQSAPATGSIAPPVEPVAPILVIV